jgi:hypothetical protein
MPDPQSLWSKRRADSPHGWLASPAPIPPRASRDESPQPPEGGRHRWGALAGAAIGVAAVGAALLEVLR